MRLTYLDASSENQGHTMTIESVKTEIPVSSHPRTGQCLSNVRLHLIDPKDNSRILTDCASTACMILLF